MNSVPYFLLGIQIEFKGICKIYPLSIEKRLSFSDDYLNSLFLPFMISEEMVKEKIGDIDVFFVVIGDKTLFASFCESLKVFCGAKNIRIDADGDKVFIDENKIPLDCAAFKEFSKIIRDWNCITIPKPEQEPEFKTEDGRRQWLNLQKLRAKKAKVEDDSLGIMINGVQFGGASYIDDSVIMQWSIWKLSNAYHAIVNNREYEHSFYAYLQGGKKDLVKQHWTERLKPKLNTK